MKSPNRASRPLPTSFRSIAAACLLVMAASCRAGGTSERSSGGPTNVGIDSALAVQLATQALKSTSVAPLVPKCFTRVAGGALVDLIPGNLRADIDVLGGGGLVAITDSGSVRVLIRYQ